MSNITYEVIKDEKVLINKINNLENLAREELMKNKSLLIEDLFFYSAIDKSLKLIDSFIFALSQRNLTVLASLTRIQLDCILRTYASTLVKSSNKFCEDVLLHNKQINKIKGIDGKNLTDFHLCELLGDALHLDLQKLYNQISGFVHFSSNSFKNISRIKDNKFLEILVSKQNFSEDAESYQRLSLELANHFYYFGKILIEVVFRSWLKQKENNNLN